jgi:two-component system chemotaxis sensor kinase CheA
MAGQAIQSRSTDCHDQKGHWLISLWRFNRGTCMSIDISRFHQTFFEESFEGLDVMESALLKLDVGNADAETINTIFRAAHSMKGGAGTFGFLEVASYTHLLETLLDQMRSGQRAVNAHDVDLLLRSVDVVRGLLTAARDSTAVDAAHVASMKTELEATLIQTPAAPARSGVTVDNKLTEPTIASGWKINFVTHAGMFRSGNDPMRILRELESLGSMAVVLDDNKLPALDQPGDFEGGLRVGRG